jgi:nodulation protein E
MVTGGSEAMLSFGGIKAWEGLRVMSKDACRPFSANRNGMVQGEGAAVFVFEEYEHAKARGAAILAEVIGFAMTSDAADIVMPSQQGAARAIAGALPTRGSTPRRSAISTPTAPARRPMTRPNVPPSPDVFGPMPTG